MDKKEKLPKRPIEFDQLLKKLFLQIKYKKQKNNHKKKTNDDGNNSL